MMEKMNRKHLLMIIAMAGMVGCSVGLTQNVAGVFFDPIASSLDSGRGPVSFSLTIYVIFSAIGSLFFKKIADRFGAELTVKTGALLLLSGTLMLGLANDLISLYLFNIIRGIGGGLIHLVTASMFINNWFEKRNGLMTSLVMAFSGFAGAVFSPLLSHLIDSYGWKMAYIFNALAMLILLIPVMFLKITYHPQDHGLLPYGQGMKEMKQDQEDDEGKEDQLNDLLLMIYGIIGGYATCVPQFFPGHAGVLNYSASFGSLLLSLSMITNIISKVILGSLTDKIGSRKAVMITSTIVLIGAIMMYKNILLYVAALLYGFCYAGATVGLTSICRQQYSKKEYLIKYPILSFISTVANAAGSPLVGSIYDVRHSYSLAFIICIIMMIVMLIVLYLLERRKCR